MYWNRKYLNIKSYHQFNVVYNKHFTSFINNPIIQSFFLCKTPPYIIKDLIRIINQKKKPQEIYITTM